MRTWAIGMMAAALALAGCDKGGSGTGTGPNGGGPLTKLVVQDAVKGTGPGAQNGDTMIMEYVGKLADGTTFDSTANRNNAPFLIVLGAGKVIKGWDQGLVGMKEGGQRKLSIPAKLAYGDHPPANSPIPMNADLFFEVKLDKLVQEADVENPVVDHLVHGSGVKAKEGDTVTIRYKETSPNGQVIDTNEDKPYDVKIGSRKSYPGLEFSLVGRQVGDTYRLTLPPRWAAGAGPNGSDSWFLFDVRVIKIKQ